MPAKDADPEFGELEWNFDTVPDNELVACCYWEYARESAFIRDVKRRCVDPKWKQMVNSELWKHCGFDIERIQSIGYASEVFLRGFFFDGTEIETPRHPDAPQITGGFPGAWQSLSKGERRERAHIGSDVKRIPLVPFERGISLDAQDIREWAKGQQAKADLEREQVRRENPKLNEETLLRTGKLRFPPIDPSVFWVGGKEVTVVRIDWGSFTNDEIVNYFRRWVKANRPDRYPVPSRKGHKPGDWRANLTRLAVMRLLSRFSALQLVDVRKNKLPAIWDTKQFSARKWGDVTKWHDARREAAKVFRTLFPFLPNESKPISWERQRPAK